MPQRMQQVDYFESGFFRPPINARDPAYLFESGVFQKSANRNNLRRTDKKHRTVGSHLRVDDSIRKLLRDSKGRCVFAENFRQHAESPPHASDAAARHSTNRERPFSRYKRSRTTPEQ